MFTGSREGVFCEIKLMFNNLLNVAKCCSENAGNRISETLDFKIFRRSMPPDPPSKAHAFGIRLMCDKS